MASMEKKNFPMNSLDPNKPYTISIEACDSDEDELPNANITIEICDSDEDELPNANISEKYVETPGLPDLNFVLPIQNNNINRQDINNQEKNNLNNTVSSSPVKSIQNTKESVTIVEHNSDNTSDDDKHKAEMESLSKVSNNLLNIIEMDGRMAEKNHLSIREIDRIKSLFQSMKNLYFSQSYDIVVSLFLPRLADKKFITNFFDYTVNNSRVNRTFECSHKTITTLFREMIKWTKYKKKHMDFHENIKRNFTANVTENPQLCPNDDKTSDNKTCDVNEGTKLTNIVSNTTTNIENLQLCPNSDQIENNESELSNANVITKESNGLLEINFSNSTHSNFNSKVTVKANDHKLLKTLLNGPQAVINRNTIYDNSNMSVQRNEILAEESSALPAGQEVSINIQTKNNVNQETVSPQTCLQKCCQNTTHQYRSDNETVGQSDSNVYIPHLENATISKSPHVVILPPNYDKEQPDMNLTLQSNTFINQSKTPLHKNTSNHSNNQYQPSFSINTVVNPDNQYQLALQDNIARNPSYHPQASLHRNTSNNSNIQYQPSLFINTVNPDVQHQLALREYFARNPSCQPQASLHRNTSNNSNIQYQPSLFQNTVVNPDNQYHLTLHDNNDIYQNNRPQASLQINNYHNSNNQYRPSLHRNTVVNPNNVPIIRGPTSGMRPNFQKSTNRPEINLNPPPIYGRNGINAINPNPPPIHRRNGINAINPNSPPISGPNGINAINQYQPINQRHNGVNPNIQHQPSLQTSSKRVPNVRYPPKLQGKRKNYQPRKTVQKKTGQMNKSNTSSSRTSSAEPSEHPNASSPANTQNEENTSNQPQEAMEQCTPTHVTSMNDKCYVCSTLGIYNNYCSKRYQVWDRHNHMCYSNEE